MRPWIYAATASLALLGVTGQANALPIDHITPMAIPSDIEEAQFFYGGRNYCWYDDGWRGPGFYWWVTPFVVASAGAAARGGTVGTAAVVGVLDTAVAVRALGSAVDTVAVDMAVVDAVMAAAAVDMADTKPN